VLADGTWSAAIPAADVRCGTVTVTVTGQRGGQPGSISHDVTVDLARSPSALMRLPPTT
jgi:hypothetical protein